MAAVNNVKQALSQEELGDLASTLPGSRIKQIARNNLNMDVDVIDFLQDEAKGNNWRFIYKLLDRYRQDKENPRQVIIIIQNNLIPTDYLFALTNQDVCIPFISIHNL